MTITGEMTVIRANSRGFVFFLFFRLFHFFPHYEYVWSFFADAVQGGVLFVWREYGVESLWNVQPVLE